MRIEDVRPYLALGWSLVPTAPRSKMPVGKWKRYQNERPNETDWEGWLAGSDGQANPFLICGGISGVVVLDLDSDGARRWWSDRLGAEVLAGTAYAQSGSGRGWHIYFAIPEGLRFKGRSVKDLEIDGYGPISFDLRGEGGGVVLPPGIHPSGGEYRWLSAPWDVPLLTLPVEAVHEALAGLEDKRAPTTETEGGDREGLAALLANPGAGGRNNWVTHVLGHFAKHLPFKDGYEAVAEWVWASASSIEADHEYDRAEFERSRESVWAIHQDKHPVADDAPPAALPNEANGFLRGDGHRLWALTIDKETKDKALAPWSTFDLRADRVLIDADKRRTYDLSIRREGEKQGWDHVVVSGSTFGSDETVRRAFSSVGGRLLNVPGDIGAVNPKCVRLQSYIEAQGPPVFGIAEWLGPWQGQYICREGVINADGLREHDRWVPDPVRLAAEQAPWEYGFKDDWATVQQVLRQVMSFQDEVAMAIIGAWWACLPIKDLIMAEASLFPLLAMIAPSGSGKTTGAPSLLWALNGRVRSAGSSTGASFREDLGKHRAGVVWIDDASNIDDLGDIIRQATAEGVMSRRGGLNYQETIRAHLVAPFVISAEGLDLLRQKAYAERAIEIDLPDPKGRKNAQGAPQYDDILALQRQAGGIGGLARWAGHIVQHVLQMGPDVVAEHHRLRPEGAGRAADNLATLRVGGRILDSLTGEAGRWSSIVDAWSQGQALRKADGYLVSTVLPAWIANAGGLPQGSEHGRKWPVFNGADGRIRVNLNLISDWWAKNHYRHDTRRAMQLGGRQAIQNELNAMGADRVRTYGLHYYRLPLNESLRVKEVAGLDDAGIPERSYETGPDGLFDE